MKTEMIVALALVVFIVLCAKGCGRFASKNVMEAGKIMGIETGLWFGGSQKL